MTERPIGLFRAQGLVWEGAGRESLRPDIGENLKSPVAPICRCDCGRTRVGEAQWWTDCPQSSPAPAPVPHRPHAAPVAPQVGCCRFPRPEQTGQKATSPPVCRSALWVSLVVLSSRRQLCNHPGGDGNNRRSSPKSAKSFCSVSLNTMQRKVQPRRRGAQVAAPAFLLPPPPLSPRRSAQPRSRRV